MLTGIQKQNGKTWLAQKLERSDGPFLCRCCGSELILKKGPIRIDHFSHKALLPCALADKKNRNDKRHREIILAIRKGFQDHSDRFSVRLEHQIGDHWTDIAITDNKRSLKLAIEVQRSPIPLVEIESRMQSYGRKGYYTVWIIAKDLNLGEQHPFDLKDKVQKTATWIRDIHKLQYGIVFYHGYSNMVEPVRLESAITWVDATDWGGGYPKELKGSRTYNIGDYISLFDLAPVVNNIVDWKPWILALPQGRRWWKK